MPFKDPEQRRTYQKEYKRRQKRLREAQAQRVTKAYLCVRHPNLRLGGAVQFRDGFFVTSSWKEQQAIETSREFGTFIVGWQVEPDPAPGNGRREFILWGLASRINSHGSDVCRGRQG